MASIVPSERLRRELDEIVAGVADEDDPIEAIGRLGARLILQQALEEELTEFLGRERYERRGEPVAHRNGYERMAVKTTAGPLELERPRLRNASALGFASEIVGKGVARTHALEALVVCSFLRGLSVRDIEAALEETFEGRSCRSRRSAGSALTPASATAPGAAGAWTSTTSSTSSLTPST
jgi:putative transposase